jgi:hypothetical protein|tara:strand:- start:990 stop:1265 length:276 start_codon:yes stop_codon:yes gene_type:complete
MRKKGIDQTPYQTNKKIRKAIDRVLEKNAINWANLGTGTMLDLKTKEATEEAWVEMSKIIYNLDSEYWVSIMKNTPGSLVEKVLKIESAQE